MVGDRAEEETTSALPGPLAAFVRSEAVGGALLAVAALVALAWANSPWRHTYAEVWGHSAATGWRALQDLTTVQAWVNGVLMAVFFFGVGLEIARERREGELADVRTAVVPVAGALGGMLGAAAVYALVNHGGPGSSGWGIPMATDIAFTLGALSLLGRRVPPGLRLLLLALAVADDIGSVVVLAVFYAARTNALALGLAAVIVVALVALRRRGGVASAWPFVVGGVALWVALAAGGVEPALAGVVAGLLVPGGVAGGRSGAGSGRTAAGSASATSGPAARLETALAPVTAFVVLPLFVLANAGVTVESTIFHPAGSGAVFAGIVAARVVGKMVGITAACLVVVLLGVGRLPGGVRWRHVLGGGAVAGLGFTVPLLVIEESFARTDPPLVPPATVGLLVGSVVALAVGAVVLGRASGHMLTPATAPAGVPPDSSAPGAAGTDEAHDTRRPTMSIAVGDRIPDVQVMTMGADGPTPVQTGEILGSGKVVLFAVPGAFTPTCSDYHLPSYLIRNEDLRAKGVDTIACVSVNDAFVMGAWGEAQHVGDQVVLLADGNGEFAKAMGLELDGHGIGLGTRSQRYAAIIEGGVVTTLNVEPGPGLSVSAADAILGAL